MKDYLKKIAIAALIIISIILIYFLYYAGAINVILRAAAAIALLVGIGVAIQRILELKGGYGFYMLGSKSGLSTIANVAKKYEVFWDVMSMWGLTLGFGLLAYPLMKGKIDKRVYAAGIISLILIMIFVFPNIGTALQFINLPDIQSALAGSSQAHAGPSLITYVIYALTIFAGFSGFLIFSLLYGAETILWSIIQFALSPSSSGAVSIANQAGVAPIIPGINIPLFAGVISIAILLIIHEFSHGVLAKKAKVKLKEIGLLVFGFIPIGGYVEPDEKMVDKLDSVKQTKIFSAGVAANFIATIVFFLLMMAFMYYIFPAAQINYHYGVVVTGTLPNYPANGILKNGMQILEWDNVSMTNLSTSNSTIAALNAAKATEKPGATITLLTNTGSYNIRAVPSQSNSSAGVIGVSIGTEYTPTINGWLAHAVYFLFTLFSLSMLLNFFVGILNFAPIPGFDGWRIYGANIKSQKFINFVGAFIIILIIVNILPWFFYL